MTITIGRFEDGRPAIFPAGPKTKPAEANDLVLMKGVIWRLVWNHNGLRLRGRETGQETRQAMMAAGWKHARLLDNAGKETGRKWVHESNAREACSFVWFASNGRLSLAV